MARLKEVCQTMLAITVGVNTRRCTSRLVLVRCDRGAEADE